MAYFKWGVLAIVLLWLTTTFAFMGTGTIGVVTSFGKVTGQELSEGFNFKAPWPFAQVHDYDVRVQKEEADVAAASVDLQTVHTKLAINYHLDRAKVSQIYQTIGTDYKRRLIDPAIQESFKASSAKYTVSELITKREEVKQTARKLLAERLEPRGIIVDDLLVVNFDFSPQFSQAIEQAQVARQQVVEAQQQLERIKVEAEQKIATAEAEAKAQQLKKESLTPELVQLKAIERWNGVMPTIVGGATPFINIPNLGK